MSKFKEFDPKESEDKSNVKLPLKNKTKENEVEQNKSSDKANDIFTPLAFTMSKTLNKKYGNRTIYHADDIANVEVIPTGSYTLNDASGIGGIAQGYIHEIFGPSGAGKTAAVLGIIASAQKMNLRCFYVDAENRFDAKRAKQFGVDASKLLMSHNNIMEQIFDIIIDVLRSGEVQLVVLDSLATLMSEKEYEEDMEKVDMGAKAKLIGKGIKKIVGTISEIKSDPTKKVPTVIMTNQIRQSTSGFGNPEFTPGGQAPKFFCSQRIRLQPKHYFDENFKEVSLSANETDNALVGVRVAHKHVKNTFAPPHRSGSYSLYWDGRCILQLEEMISLALVNGVIEQISAVSYQFEDQRFVGKQNMLTYFKESKSAAKKLSDKIIALTDKKDIETSNDPILSDYESP